MTMNEFTALCENRTIPPQLALENEDIREALAIRDDEAVIDVLDNEF